MAQSSLVDRVEANPKYQELKRRRNAFGWTLTAIMMVVYYGYILIIAFDKSIFAAKIGAGVTTVGIPVGIGVIVFTIVITGLYVRKANKEFDPINEEIIKEENK